MNAASDAVNMFVKTGTLTQADLLGMYANPVLVLGAPPAGATYNMYVVHQLVMISEYSTVAFYNGGILCLQYGDTAKAKGILAAAEIAASLLGEDYNQAVIAIGTTDTTAPSPLSGMIGTGLYITNDSNAFEGGSANSTATYYIYYSTLSVL